MNEMSKIKRNPAAVKIANEILKEYDCNSLADMQDALKEILYKIDVCKHHIIFTRKYNVEGQILHKF